MPSRVMSSVAVLASLVPHIHAAATSYDYVIVGGGTAGSVIASRLSQDPKVTVAVIEAGDAVFDNDVVKDATNPFASMGSALDWQYPSVPQRFAGNGTIDMHAGKALGGTSTINGMTYLRAESVQIDAWESLGNHGWNWASLFPYYKKSEQFAPPSPSQAADGATFDPSAHGTQGPLNVGWHSLSPQSGNATEIVKATWAALGQPSRDDPNGGKMSGFSVWPLTLDAATSVREDAARAYLLPNLERKNLHLLLNTTALRLSWKNGATKGGLVATGVEVVSANGEKTTVTASKEVIVSLGGLRTPPFLEYSGVGNPAILKKFGIPVRVDLPSVGENLQDQTNVPLTALASPNDTSFLGYPTYVTYPTASDLFGANLSAVESTVRFSIPAYAAQNVAASKGATTLAIQKKLLTAQIDLIFKNAHTLPIAEILTAPLPGSIITVMWASLPLGRGSVHIASADATSAPAIDPNFFMNAFDAQTQVATQRLARRALGTAPLADHVLPGGADALPAADASDAAWLAYAKGAYGSNSHPLGTAAMMSRELGGVVDTELRVYGTANVRVVDASILPLQTCGHPTSTLYAVAERAAELIRGHGL